MGGRKVRDGLVDTHPTLPSDRSTHLLAPPAMSFRYTGTERIMREILAQRPQSHLVPSYFHQLERKTWLPLAGCLQTLRQQDRNTAHIFSKSTLFAEYAHVINRTCLIAILLSRLSDTLPTMPAITVDLGNVTVRRSETNTFSLSLTSSCTIDLPPTWTESPNASEIASAVKEGTLWITKAGSCQLDFAVLVNGNPPSEEDIGEATLLKILDLVAECPVSDSSSLSCSWC